MFDREAHRPADKMEQVELDIADLPRWIGEALARTNELGVDGDAAQIKLVIEHDTGERD